MLVPIADGLWGFDSEVRLPGGLRFPLRTTVVALPGDALAVVAPGPLDETLAETLEAEGHVAHLIAPNRFHHLYVDAWAKRFPDARRWAAPGLPEKRPDLSFHDVLSADPEPLRDTFGVAPIDGIPAMSEVVLFHRRTRSLVVTDLVFHITEARGWMSKLTFKMLGVYGTLAQSRAARFMTKDREKAAAGVEHVLSWRFDRVVPAHGPVVDASAHHRLEKALHWMRNAPAS